MTYRIEGLPRAPFQPLFDLSDQELAERGARSLTATRSDEAPCRVSLRDADAGERLILAHHAHLTDPSSPYRSGGPIFVREAAEEADMEPEAVPGMLRRRPLSVRVYDRSNMMIQGELIEGAELDRTLRRWFETSQVETVHIHFAPRGCYLAKAVRSGAAPA